MPRTHAFCLHHVERMSHPEEHISTATMGGLPLYKMPSVLLVHRVECSIYLSRTSRDDLWCLCVVLQRLIRSCVGAL